MEKLMAALQLRSIHFDPFQRFSDVRMPLFSRLLGVRKVGDFTYVDVLCDPEQELSLHPVVCLEAGDPTDGISLIGSYLGSVEYGPPYEAKVIHVFDGQLESAR